MACDPTWTDSDASVEVTPRSAVVLAGSTTVNLAIASGKKKKGSLTTTSHVPRLSTEELPTNDVASIERESVSGSVEISVERTIDESAVAQVMRRGKNPLNETPNAFTHTVCPTVKTVCGVEQSSANVAIAADDCTTGMGGGNGGDHAASTVELAVVRGRLTLAGSPLAPVA